MRIFKTRTLAKFTRQHGIDDAALVEAVDRAKRGLIDADLGGKVIKQRVARPGQGKRSGFRMLIGFGSDRAVYLFAFAKNERENISNGELFTLREIAASFLGANKEKIDQAINDGTLIDVHDGNESKKEGKDQSARKGAAGNGA
ncbi:type II toxin-antitoxin system RelE/ParE family toxin [Bradyrhizobium diazoefficiens]|uniref:type II toxin-antitoxin system RelE/ParE family toxin n=1 Tax=Bradyrhizobium diazoefficiens TaxID=1355477 RepID=UPI00190D3603|nr:type II toxin-antitoxin system RelE/ParE family toxin [Bradyrhizobium diazoefficiens]MBK3662515.1 type II toxin-antitoxin system RelE/ParE family toxin [Bradyrhizobium diazoefficiens]